MCGMICKPWPVTCSVWKWFNKDPVCQGSCMQVQKLCRGWCPNFENTRVAQRKHTIPQSTMKNNCNIIQCCNNTHQGAPHTGKQTSARPWNDLYTVSSGMLNHTDRLIETDSDAAIVWWQAFAEELHERVRKEFWAYSVDEKLDTKQLHQIRYNVSLLCSSLLCCGFLRYTVKLCYNGLTYNISLVLAYISSWSRHFSIQNMSVSMYLDIMYPRLLRTDFGPKPYNGPRLVCTFVRRHAVFAVDFSQ